MDLVTYSSFVTYYVCDLICIMHFWKLSGFCCMSLCVFFKGNRPLSLTFTFMHLAHAFIQSNLLHCYHNALPLSHRNLQPHISKEAQSHDLQME